MQLGPSPRNRREERKDFTQIRVRIERRKTTCISLHDRNQNQEKKLAQAIPVELAEEDQSSRDP